MSIDYKVNQPISVETFIDLLERSTLAERRPIEDIDCMYGMLSNSNLVITAWDKDKLIGIARSLTDFYFWCYLADLAVDEAYQHSGIGKALQLKTREQLQSRCKLFLLAAPKAKDYYSKIGYSKVDRCWMVEPEQEVD